MPININSLRQEIRSIVLHSTILTMTGKKNPQPIIHQSQNTTLNAVKFNTSIALFSITLHLIHSILFKKKSQKIHITKIKNILSALGEILSYAQILQSKA